MESSFHIPGTVFTGNADLLGSLRHLGGVVMDGLYEAGGSEVVEFRCEYFLVEAR